MHLNPVIRTGSKFSCGVDARTVMCFPVQLCSLDPNQGATKSPINQRDLFTVMDFYGFLESELKINVMKWHETRL